MKKIQFPSFLIFMFCLIQGYAQAPSWSVNPNQYQYSMTITAVLDLNCTELTSPSNQLAAFVGDSIRGVATTSTIIGGRYQASMTIYSDNVNGEMVHFKFYRVSANTVYTSIDSIAFQDNAIYGSPAFPVPIRTNNRPTQLSLNSHVLNENQPVGTVVTSLSTTDLDAGQTHQYSLVAGFGSTDNASFGINGSNLTANFIADYEVKSTYEIRLRTTDTDGCSLDSNYTIQIADVNDPPTGVLLSSNQINENNAINATVGNLTAIDSDLNESFTYSLVAGAGDADNASFNIVGNVLRASVNFNYEVKDIYHLRVQVMDQANNTFSDSLLVLVNNLNEAPTDVLITVDSIVENMPVNTIIGNLSVLDEDFGQSHSFSFDNVPGNNNAQFNIVGNSLRAASIFDFEAVNVYFIYVMANDFNGGTLTKQLTINVVDGNDLPSDIQLSSTSVNENQPVGEFVATLLTSDQDAVSTFSYSLVSGVGNADNAKFQIRNDSLFTNAVFDVNVQSQFSIRIQTNDGNGGNFSKAFSITALDVNNAPNDIFLSNNNVPEATTLGSVVGVLTSSDPDLSNTHIYTLVPGAGDTDNGNFTITGSDLKTDTVFNVNVKSQYSIRVRTTDNLGLFYEKSLSINIINSNDAPTDIQLTPASIKENSAVNSVVGLLTSSDPDTADTHTYTFANLSANDNASFAIVGNELRASASFDFEVKPIYFVQIQSTDAGGDSYSKQLIVNILDSNDRATDMVLSNNTVPEKQSPGVFVGDLTAVDQDASDTYTYALVSGAGSTDNGSFTVRNDSLFSNASFDFIQKSQLSIRVRVTDSGNLTYDKNFTIQVQDVNDAPIDLSIDNSSIPENIIINSAVGVFTSSDIDLMQTFTYTLVAGAGDSENSNFTIVGSELKTNSLFDYNVKRTHSIRVRTTDQGGLSFEKTFVIQITNTNDAPTDIQLDSNKFMENLPLSTRVAVLNTVDKDSSDTFSYSFVNQGTNDNASFIIAGAELRTAVPFDFESKQLYIIEVQARDNGGLTYSRQITLEVLDDNDAPISVSISNDSLLEKSPKGTYVADLSTLDPDAVETFTYALVPGNGATDNGLFRINGNLLESDSVLDYNNATSRRIRVLCTDKGGKTISNQFIIRIKNRNDLPTDISISDTIINETSSIGSRVGTLATVDEDRNDSFTYTLVAGSGDADNASFQISGSELISAVKLDFETKTSYTVRLRSTDNAGASVEKVFTIHVEDGNEPPVMENQTFSLPENSGSMYPIGKLIVSDFDLNEKFSFKILGSKMGFTVDFLTGELSTSISFDYELSASYDILIEVSDSLGLKDTATITMEILDQIEGNLPAAGYFSPNGDGINDTWMIQNVNLYSNYKLNIFSANGTLVYESSGAYNNDWDGTTNGKQLPEGVYYYVLVDSQNSSKLFKGIITLKR